MTDPTSQSQKPAIDSPQPIRGRSEDCQTAEFPRRDAAGSDGRCNPSGSVTPEQIEGQASLQHPTAVAPIFSHEPKPAGAVPAGEALAIMRRAIEISDAHRLDGETRSLSIVTLRMDDAESVLSKLVEAAGRADAVPALDVLMRERGLPTVADALGYSRNFASANPALSQTTRDHIEGLCSMLEIAAQHPPVEPEDSLFIGTVRKLVIAARTSGGTAGRDDGLCAALDAVEAMLSEPAARAQVGEPDDIAVDRFAAAMKEKMAAARAKGRGGWDGPTCNAQLLSDMLRDHVAKGDPRDVADFCMMLWNRGESIQPAPAPQQMTTQGKAVADVGHAYEWKEPTSGKWLPINRPPHQWEREMGIEWRPVDPIAAAKVQAYETILADYQDSAKTGNPAKRQVARDIQREATAFALGLTQAPTDA